MNVRNQAFYKGLWFGMQMLILCALINIANISFDTNMLAFSASLSAIFLGMFLFFPIYHATLAVKYRKLIKNQDIRELVKYKWQLLFGEFADTHYVRYFFMWAFALRRFLNAYVVVFMTDPLWQLIWLFIINLFALLWNSISRPYNDVLINVHMIINDIGLLIVLGEFHVYREVFLKDKEFYSFGRMIIGTIAGVVLLNFALFIISFILGVIRFLRKCPICSCCNKKIRLKEEVIRDVSFCSFLAHNHNSRRRSACRGSSGRVSRPHAYS